ncbi:hypothetical protein K0J45_03065 [Shewanella alkalitolerans]|uniref:hypothetical protein n=1 Tax=Shewanella alkalitolerans TaxID=2864209 RepID=UPI001C659739|nr:hypothetical protein [Shewanella alkalitolerans]QYJ98238.1 hypothetical protein K0J45_03065 [Shewanella alkalitolerans]
MKYENLSDIASALMDLKHELIVINLVVVCLAIVGVYFHARIRKSAELREINNNFTEVLKQQKELTSVTGKIKQSLEHESISYQIRLNAYHEKSIEAINDIYVSIIKLRDEAKTVTFSQEDVIVQQFISSVTEFRNTFDTRKIWIPKDLSAHIESVAKDIDKRTHKFIYACKRINNLQGLSEKRIDALFEIQDGFYDYVNEEMGLVFDKLVEKVAEHVGM